MSESHRNAVNDHLHLYTTLKLRKTRLAQLRAEIDRLEAIFKGWEADPSLCTSEEIDRLSRRVESISQQVDATLANKNRLRP